MREQLNQYLAVLTRAMIGPVATGAAMLVLLTAAAGCASAPPEPTPDIEAIYLAAFQTAVAAAATPTPLPTEPPSPTPDLEASYVQAVTPAFDGWNQAYGLLGTEMEKLSVTPSLLDDETWKAGVTAALQDLQASNAAFAALPPAPESLQMIGQLIAGLAANAEQLAVDITNMLADVSYIPAVEDGFGLVEADREALEAALAPLRVP
jgi:hypothetical protein